LCFRILGSRFEVLSELQSTVITIVEVFFQLKHQ
jgi:hypothetical protein